MNPNETTQLDPQAVNLAKAIRQTESGGNFNAKGKSGEYGAYQFTQPTWESQSKKYGVNAPLDKATPEQQNEVAYKQIKEWKDKGFNVGQIASMWNAGEGNPDAYIKGHAGVNKYGVKYDTGAYAKSVATAYQTLKNGGQVNADPNNPSSIVAPETKPEQRSLGGFIGNLASSAGDFAGGVIDAVRHPFKTIESVANLGAGAIEKGAQGLIDITGLNKYQKGGPINTEESQMAGKVGKFYKDRYGGVENIKNTLYKDPVGAAADASVLLGGAAGIAGKVGEAGELAGASKLASGLRKASEITDPIRLAGRGVGAVGKLAKESGLYGVAKVTGKETGTLKAVLDNPKAFSPEEIPNITRQSLGKEIGDALSGRQQAISETGEAYQPIRESMNPVYVEKNYLENLLKDNTGLTVKDGKLVTSGSASIRDTRDVNALQHIYDTYQPIFDQGLMTPNEYLNLRSDLAQIAGYGRELTKSKPLQGLSSIMRGQTNTALRPQIAGLEALDAKFGPQIEEFNKLKAGLLDKDGNLSDAAINRISNATGKGKDQLLARLEQISPGITQKIRIVKALEDIQNINKVGTYTKSALEMGGLIGGVSTANIPLIASSIATMLLTQPEIAVKILRAVGGGSKLAGAVLENLRIPAQSAARGLVGAQRLGAASK